eukprot:m.32214 g.32214  ORF g.32214 m.32214 type:complete len:463 (+) comp4972_c0_seq1:22-1410(+)
MDDSELEQSAEEENDFLIIEGSTEVPVESSQGLEETQYISDSELTILLAGAVKRAACTRLSPCPPPAQDHEHVDLREALLKGRDLYSKAAILDAAVIAHDGALILQSVLALRDSLSTELFHKLLLQYPSAIDQYVHYLMLRGRFVEAEVTLRRCHRADDALLLAWSLHRRSGRFYRPADYAASPWILRAIEEERQYTEWSLEPCKCGRGCGRTQAVRNQLLDAARDDHESPEDSMQREPMVPSTVMDIMCCDPGECLQQSLTERISVHPCQRAWGHLQAHAARGDWTGARELLLAGQLRLTPLGAGLSHPADAALHVWRTAGHVRGESADALVALCRGLVRAEPACARQLSAAVLLQFRDVAKDIIQRLEYENNLEPLVHSLERMQQYSTGFVSQYPLGRGDGGLATALKTAVEAILRKSTANLVGSTLDVAARRLLSGSVPSLDAVSAAAFSTAQMLGRWR